MLQSHHSRFCNFHDWGFHGECESERERVQRGKSVREAVWSVLDFTPPPSLHPVSPEHADYPRHTQGRFYTSHWLTLHCNIVSSIDNMEFQLKLRNNSEITKQEFVGMRYMIVG